VVWFFVFCIFPSYLLPLPLYFFLLTLATCLSWQFASLVQILRVNSRVVSNAVLKKVGQPEIRDERKSLRGFLCGLARWVLGGRQRLKMRASLLMLIYISLLCLGLCPTTLTLPLAHHSDDNRKKKNGKMERKNKLFLFSSLFFFFLFVCLFVCLFCFCDVRRPFLGVTISGWVTTLSSYFFFCSKKRNQKCIFNARFFFFRDFFSFKQFLSLSIVFL